MHLLFRNHTNRIGTTGNNRGYINNPPLLPQFPGFLPRSSPPQWQSASHLRQWLNRPWLNHPTVGFFQAWEVGVRENSGCWVVKQQPKNTSITLPKFNMEPKNESGSRILILKKTIYMKMIPKRHPVFHPPPPPLSRKSPGWF